MQGYNFSEGVRRSLALAREEANRLQHEYVGTEHMLLGMLKRGDGGACAALEALKVNAVQLAARIEQTVTRGTSTYARADLPYTTRTKAVLELALGSAHALGDSSVGREHLLLGMIEEKHGIAAQVLAEAGVTRESALAKILETIGRRTPGVES